MGGKGWRGLGQEACAIRWGGVACVLRAKKDSERDQNRKVDGEKKNDKSGKKEGVGKKRKTFFTMVLGRIDP